MEREWGEAEQEQLGAAEALVGGENDEEDGEGSRDRKGCRVGQDDACDLGLGGF